MKLKKWSDIKRFFKYGYWPEEIEEVVDKVLKKEKKLHPRQIIPEVEVEPELDDLWKLIPYWTIIINFKDNSTFGLNTLKRHMEPDMFDPIMEWFQCDLESPSYNWSYKTGSICIARDAIKYINIKEIEEN